MLCSNCHSAALEESVALVGGTAGEIPAAQRFAPAMRRRDIAVAVNKRTDMHLK